MRLFEEELGLRLTVGDLLVVDWVPRFGIWSDALHFVFDGGLITEQTIGKFVFQPAEIRGATLASMAEIRDHVRPSMHRRLGLAQQALSSRSTLYGEFGRLAK